MVGVPIRWSTSLMSIFGGLLKACYISQETIASNLVPLSLSSEIICVAWDAFFPSQLSRV